MSSLRKLVPIVLVALWGAAPGPAHAAAGDWYLALGDSLAAGVQSQPSVSGGAYASRLAVHLQSTDPGIQLKNIACSGATTTSFVSTQTCDSTFPGTQLGEAEAFLTANRGHVPLVTIDIGGNDVDGCINGASISGPCLAAGFAAIDKNVPQIVSGLAAAAGPETRFAMMTYYNPLLEDWVTGSSGQTIATETVGFTDALNAKLVGDFGPSFVVADVSKAFSTDDESDMVNTPNHGIVPQDVAMICQLTGGCDFGFNLHANSVGHQLIADTFFAALTNSPTPPASALSPSVSGVTVQGQTLTGAHGAWTNSPSSLEYQWQKCDPLGAACASIGGATGQTYLLGGADVGHTIRVQEFATNASGTGGPAVSTATGVVQAEAVARPMAPSNDSRPVIRGTTTVGRSLAVSVGTWSGTPPLSFSYRWRRCDRRCVTITGAAGSSYALVRADTGSHVLVEVSATNSVGEAVAASRQIGPVTPSATRIKRLLSAELVPAGKAAKIAAILRAGGYWLSIKGLSAGRAVLSWYLAPRREHVARAKAAKPELVASGKLRFSDAGRGKLKIKLTKAGERLLKGSKRLMLDANATFTPTRAKAITTNKKFTLER